MFHPDPQLALTILKTSVEARVANNAVDRWLEAAKVMARYRAKCEASHKHGRQAKRAQFYQRLKTFRKLNKTTYPNSGPTPWTNN